MKVPSALWRGGLLAAGLMVLGACTQPDLPIDLQFAVNRDAAASAGQRAPVKDVVIDLAMYEGGSTFDAVCEVGRDGHMHFGIFRDGRHLAS